MAQLNAVNFKAKFDALFADNTTGEISEADLRAFVQDLVDSFFNNVDSDINSFRGGYAGGTTFPATGGRLSGGIPAAGDRWRLTSTLTIGGTDVYEAGTIIEAAINTPGQTTGNWIKYAVQL